MPVPKPSAGTPTKKAPVPCRTGSEAFTRRARCGALSLLSRFLFRDLHVARAIFLLESLNTSRCVDKLLISSIERMAARAYFRAYFLGCAAGFECVSTTAVYHDCLVLGVYILFHDCRVPKRKRLMLAGKLRLSTSFCDLLMISRLPAEKKWSAHNNLLQFA